MQQETRYTMFWWRRSLWVCRSAVIFDGFSASRLSW